MLLSFVPYLVVAGGGDDVDFVTVYADAHEGSLRTRELQPISLDYTRRTYSYTFQLYTSVLDTLVKLI